MRAHVAKKLYRLYCATQMKKGLFSDAQGMFKEKRFVGSLSDSQAQMIQSGASHNR